MNNTDFEKNGYVFIKELLDESTVSVLSQYYEYKILRGEWKESDKDDTSKYYYYADPLTEVFLKICQPSIEQACGLLLFPTYSYARIYQNGEKLLPHVDRESCEISVTINIANKGAPSPVWMQYGDEIPTKYSLSPGDAIVYKGIDVMHWRRPLKEDQLVVQCMLHYVDVDGINKKYKYDMRQSLGMKFSGESL